MLVFVFVLLQTLLADMVRTVDIVIEYGVGVCDVVVVLCCHLYIVDVVSVVDVCCVICCVTVVAYVGVAGCM